MYLRPRPLPRRSTHRLGVSRGGARQHVVVLPHGASARHLRAGGRFRGVRRRVRRRAPPPGDARGAGGVGIGGTRGGRLRAIAGSRARASLRHQRAGGGRGARRGRARRTSGSGSTSPAGDIRHKRTDSGGLLGSMFNMGSTSNLASFLIGGGDELDRDDRDESKDRARHSNGPGKPPRGSRNGDAPSRTPAGPVSVRLAFASARASLGPSS